MLLAIENKRNRSAVCPPFELCLDEIATSSFNHLKATQELALTEQIPYLSKSISAIVMVSMFLAQQANVRNNSEMKF